VWLAFIIFPLVNAVTSSDRLVVHVLVIAGAAVFVADYTWMVLTAFGDRNRAVALLQAIVLVAVSASLTIGDSANWAFLFTYCAACAAILAPSSLGFHAVVLTSLMAAGSSLLGGGTAGSSIGYGASAIGIGLLMVVMRDLRVSNAELTEARAELARAAVTAERERFARDLHDLLGHSLSVIAIKAELAGRLLPDRADQATVEVREVEQVARQALREVRDAVSGYRQPTLDGELAGARMALSAAGITAEFDRPPVTLDPEVEAVLAWTVREGATNVIRHSGARRCTVKVRTGLAAAAVEVLDDGPGQPGDGAGQTATNGQRGRDGHGLAGLTERAESLRGRLEAGALPEGGFRLNVSVPVGARR
jgi:two-component system sensor histidine kinase DesK